ncbi:hypothetical protein PROFUN_00936 [Planoprotostelium fungivorum]|uniref:Uncharacterized protein n=1 Tax=Planoprotostelium fungivorum TaxID=1890364 RepID=A0A2P6N4A4_9EUKA|nr:hypothetical protein PROFUN_00936 [Planoprotostelium fungivorum]
MTGFNKKDCSAQRDAVQAHECLCVDHRDVKFRHLDFVVHTRRNMNKGLLVIVRLSTTGRLYTSGLKVYIDLTPSLK